MSTSKIWLSKINDSPKGFLFWLKATGLLILIVFLLAELIGLFAFGWNDFQPIFALGDLVNSLFILIGGTGLACFLGISLAFLTTNYEFPGRKIMPWLFLLPIVLPTYAFAFTYNSFFGYTGPWQSFLQILVGPQTAKMLVFSTKTTFWVAVWTGLSTFPYVYLFFSNAFKSHTFFYLEIAKSLKQNNLRLFKNIVFPLTKPLLFSIISLLFILGLNEYGASKYNEINTATTRLIDAFLSYGNGTDTNLKKWMATIGGLIAIFYFGIALTKRKKQAPPIKHSAVEITRTTLSKKKMIVVLFLCSIIGLMSIVIPITELVRLMLASVSWSKFIPLGINTAMLTIVVLVMITILRTLYEIIAPQLATQDKLETLTHLTFAFFARLPGFLLGFISIILIADFNGILNNPLGSIDSKNAVLQILTLITGCTIYLLGTTSHFNQLEFSHSLPNPKSWSINNTSFYNQLKSTWSFNRSAVVLAILFIECTKELPINLMSEYSPFPTLASYGFNLARSGLLTSAAAVVFMLLIVNSIPFLVLIKNIKS